MVRLGKASPRTSGPTTRPGHQAMSCSPCLCPWRWPTTWGGCTASPQPWPSISGLPVPVTGQAFQDLPWIPPNPPLLMTRTWSPNGLRRRSVHQFVQIVLHHRLGGPGAGASASQQIGAVTKTSAPMRLPGGSWFHHPQFHGIGRGSEHRQDAFRTHLARKPATVVAMAVGWWAKSS